MISRAPPNTHPGDDLTLVATSLFIPFCLVVLCIFLIIYLKNAYWTNHGRINGPNNSKVYGQAKMIMITPKEPQKNTHFRKFARTAVFWPVEILIFLYHKFKVHLKSQTSQNRAQRKPSKRWIDNMKTQINKHR